MKEEDKRLIVEFCGLKWHKQDSSDSCTCGYEVQGWGKVPDMASHFVGNLNLDPLSPADMYGKIWPAFEDKEKFLQSHAIWRDVGGGGWIFPIETILMFMEAPDLANALLDFIKEKKDD